MAGQTVKVQADGGAFDAYVSVPAAGKGPGVVLVTHIYGVDEDTRDMCDKLAAQGYVALAQNFFWRDQDSGVLHHGEEGGKRARARAERIDFGKAMDDLKRAVAHVKSQPGCNGKVAVFGYCFGGAYVWRAACDLGIDSGFSFHGTFVSKSMKPGDKAGCPVAFHYGDKDHLAPPPELEAVKKVADAQKGGEFVIHPGAAHGYMFPHNPAAYHAEAARKSWDRALEMVGALKGAKATAAE
jgi:carboxymethylenebutenolidase